MHSSSAYIWGGMGGFSHSTSASWISSSKGAGPLCMYSHAQVSTNLSHISISSMETPQSTKALIVCVTVGITFMFQLLEHCRGRVLPLMACMYAPFEAKSTTAIARNRQCIHTHDDTLARIVHQMATLCARERVVSLLQSIPRMVVLPAIISSIK